MELASEDVQLQHHRYSPVDWMKIEGLVHILQTPCPKTPSENL